MSVIPRIHEEHQVSTSGPKNDGIVVMERGEGSNGLPMEARPGRGLASSACWPAVHGVGEGKIIVAIGEDGGIAYSLMEAALHTSRPSFAGGAPRQ